MARLLFIENRTTTLLWREVARKLRSDGHEVHVLVFNPFYSEDAWGDIIVPLPRHHDLSTDIPGELGDVFARIAKTDRNLRYYGGNPAHYGFYYSKVRRAVEDYRPDLVFGEATTFYELMCAEICKKLGILYLSPLTSRYPPGRFSFFQYDTLEPFEADSSYCPSREECLGLIDSICNRTIVTDDVRGSSWLFRLTLLPRKARDKILLLKGYLEGERFCTPSPLRRGMLALGTLVKKRLWDITAALKRPPDASPGKRANCLYAMQMQPEAAIDVYGTEWNDQEALVDRLSRICEQHGLSLLVKANPKFKLEVTLRLIGLAIKRSNVYLLPRRTAMKAALANSSVVVSVTGTVLMECILSGKPVVALADHPISRQKGCTIACRESEISAALGSAANGQAEASTEDEKIEYLKRLTQNTFRGLISEPIGDPACVTKENISDLREAFARVLEVRDARGGQSVSHRPAARRSRPATISENHA